jgi:hypothetical protein
LRVGGSHVALLGSSGGLAPSVLGTSKSSVTSSLGVSGVLVLGLTLSGSEVPTLMPSTRQRHRTGGGPPSATLIPMGREVVQKVRVRINPLIPCKTDWLLNN